MFYKVHQSASHSCVLTSFWLSFVGKTLMVCHPEALRGQEFWSHSSYHIYLSSEGRNSDLIIYLSSEDKCWSSVLISHLSVLWGQWFRLHGCFLSYTVALWGLVFWLFHIHPVALWGLVLVVHISSCSLGAGVQQPSGGSSVQTSWHSWYPAALWGQLLRPHGCSQLPSEGNYSDLMVVHGCPLRAITQTSWLIMAVLSLSSCCYPLWVLWYCYSLHSILPLHSVWSAGS